MKLLVFILGLLVLQIIAEELETCITKEECLADQEKSKKLADERFWERIQLAENIEEEMTESFKANVTAFNNDVENASKLCQNHMILGENAVMTALEDSYFECREELENYSEAKTDGENAMADLLSNETPVDEKDEEWTQNFCEWYPEFVNIYCGYLDNQYETLKNGCIKNEFERLYVSPWQECVRQTTG